MASSLIERNGGQTDGQTNRRRSDKAAPNRSARVRHDYDCLAGHLPRASRERNSAQIEAPRGADVLFCRRRRRFNNIASHGAASETKAS